MTEGRTTATYAGVALALAAVTWATAPRVKPSSAFADRGEVLFPQFNDPNLAASLEVTDFDPRTATVHPLKVQNRNGRWTIPSQHDYPADAGDRLAKTAAAVIALRKEDVVSDNATDYERCGVRDPLDTTVPNVAGRGTRIVVRGTREEVLADIILGKPVEAHPGYRYIRLPNQKRVYISNTGDLKISTAFGDWIDRDLLQVAPDEIDAVNLRNYALDRSTGRVDPGETLLLQAAKNGEWTLNGLAPDQQVNPTTVDNLLRSLATLRITGVLPKPAGITATLSHEVSRTTIAPDDKADLARKGFYMTPNGQLVSNRGEIVVRSRRGVFYTLRFGDIAPGSDAPAADRPAGEDDEKPGAARENRYLFIMVDFDAGSAETPGRAAEGAEKVQLLRARFAPWYYVISADSFAAIRLGRKDLIQRSDTVRR